MRQQVFVIHGGNAFDTDEEYILHLKAKKVSLADLAYSDWKHSLQGTLGDAYEVLLPRMPSANNAKYLEWKIYFEKFVPLLSNDVLLVGHSLGGLFLVKYLSEEEYPRPIKAVLLVAAPFNTASQHPLADFVIGDNLEKFQQQVEHTFLYHSKDDEVVPFSNFEQYKKKLSNSEQRVLDGRNHLNQEEFPELIEDIKSLV